ncbi:putative dispersed gene family protein 1 (DGF-1) [Trypanosoma grayi]|uniref:putative dispersed gene family protein 1 (DGF-1) n=1 Tax=Trypanosoma grayi TaxID=71804 RepID=UPI0004F49211|nr:putative dispersed gene family protein 1 (DGF-1) [Trypanosoma grayi]KEG06585.1 putative dispersed gene family protein 1 (DGF-1) [Trypanosoma grayi]
MVPRLSRVATTFENEADSHSFTNDTVNEESSEGDSFGASLSACIVACLPHENEKVPRHLLSIIVLTNGTSVWRVEVYEDGTFAEDEFRDSKGHTGSIEESSRSSGLSSWLPSWPWDGKQARRTRYLAISAVQQTQYIVLFRSNGLLELFDSYLRPVCPIPPCVLSKEEVLVSNVVTQWSTLVNDDVHVITCFGGKEVRRCVWSRIPVTETSDRVPCAQKMMINPPSATSAPVACVALDTRRLALLWDVGMEEGVCMHSSISIGSLMHSTQQGLSGILQVITAQKGLGEAEDHNARATNARVLMERAEVFFCHSSPLHALMSVGEELVLIEKVHLNIRAHVLSTEMSPLEQLVENAIAVGRPVMTANRNVLPLPWVHLIPAVVRNDIRPSCSNTLAFDEGVELAASCAEGADNLAALLISAVQSVPVALTLGGFQLLRSAAHLQGYVPSGFVDDAAMKTAVEHATAFVEIPSRSASFCSFSRRFVQHTISRDLLSRIAYLVCSYIGWIGSGLVDMTSLELPRIRVILEFLSAAYHAVDVAGPFTAAIAPEVGKTVVADVLKVLLCSKPDWGEEGEDALFAVYVANRLRRCDGAVGMRASATWCNLLSRRYPCLQHFLILRDLEVSRTARSSQLVSMCLAVSFHLASLPAAVAVPLLLEGGLSACGKGGALHTAFSDVGAEEWRAVLANVSLVAKVYRVALLRRVIPPDGSNCACVSGSLVRELFLTELVELEQYVRLAGGPGAKVYRALVELRLETHMFLARAALDEPSFNDSFRSLAEVLRCAAELDMTPMYMEQVLLVICEVVELASSSQGLLDALVSLTHSSAELDSILASKWYAYTARLPTKSASPAADVTRLRAATGLYRYLCKRHAYGQAGRMMTDLATVIRCSSLRSSSVEAVLEITALAVTAVELIAPTAPLQLQQDDRETSMLTAYGSPTYPHSPEQASPKGPLNREHLPWLRRRHYQAFCERKLMDASRRVDCTDLWIENPPAAAYAAAVKRFVEALMESRFWPEARRFAAMTGYDVGRVLQEHVLDLLAFTDYTTDEEALEEWCELIEGCEEFSSPLNRFGPLRSTVVTALVTNFENTHPALLASLERADRYEAMHALLEVAETLLCRRTEAMRVKARLNEEEFQGPSSCLVTNDNADKSGGGCSSGRNTFSITQPWLPLVESLRIGTGVLMDSLHGNTREGGLSDASMTAGIFDPMACRALELLNSPLLLDQLVTVQGATVVKTFLQSFEEFKRAKLVLA